jgi:hypothetical protein
MSEASAPAASKSVLRGSIRSDAKVKAALFAISKSQVAAGLQDD